MSYRPQDREPGVVSRFPGEIVEIDFRGQPIRFFVRDKADYISRYHDAGIFYEVEELDLIARYVGPGSRILEIGCHVGNHTIYFEKCLRAESILVFDINPATIAHFRIHKGLNDLGTVSEAYLGLGLSGRTERMSYYATASNTGATWLVPSADGEIQTLPGDMILLGKAFDFAKIDVEGLEVEVLTGLSETFAAHQPLIFVEVAIENVDAVLDWVRRNNYAVEMCVQRYVQNLNLLLTPARSAES